MPTMKRIITCLLLLLSALPSALRADDSSLWTYHLSYRNAQRVVCGGDLVYGLFGGNLLAYDTTDGSVREFDRRNTLSGKNVSYMGYSLTQHCLVLLYADRNVDLLYDNGTVVNIPQIKSYSDYDITVSNLCVNADWATISTTDGIIALDLKKQEVKGYYRIQQSVSDAVVTADGTIFAAIGSNVYSSKLTDNIYSFSAWTKAYGVLVSSFVPFAGGFYMIAPFLTGQANGEGGLYFTEKDDSGKWATERINTVWLDRGNATAQRAQFVGSNGVYMASADSPKAVTGTTLGHYLYDVTRDAKGNVWLADGENGLNGYDLSVNGSETSLQLNGSTIGGFGPLRDYAFRVSYNGNRLLVSGGQFFISRAGTAEIYEDGKWTFLNATSNELTDGVSYIDVSSIAEDPADANHHFVSFFGGLAEFRDGKLAHHYNSSNSGLKQEERSGSNRPQYTFVDGLQYDSEENLWMLNVQTNEVAKVLTPEGKWYAIPVDGFNASSTHAQTLLFDSDGRAWITSRRSSSVSSGLACLDYAGTIDDTSDDQSLFRSTARNEDGTQCDISDVRDICFDRNGQLWIGAANGVFAVTDPSTWFNSDFTIYQPKVPRNDGTNYADYLLTGIDVTAVAVDGGNRKWLGTVGSGVYVVNEDGSEVLQHFTTDNSPILSDNVYSIAIHPTTGEVMIATDLGLCSYSSCITEPAETLTKANVKVYPNPVRPEHRGNVTITGLTAGAEVKILGTSGQLVARGRSTGGSFIWDVCGPNGDRVAAGVYYIMVANANGSTSVAAKMVVI